MRRRTRLWSTVPAAAVCCAAAVLPGPAAGAELPRGGTRIFPDHRVVALAGTPGAPALGGLGIGSLASATARLGRQARAYAFGGRRILPALDLITVIADRHPGRDRLYSHRVASTVVARHLRAARRSRSLLLLNIQPGRSSFIREVRAYDRFLAEPEVGVALDPEWNMGPRGVPGRTIGSARVRELNRVLDHLDRVVRRRGLPQKLVVIHQFTEGMLPDRRLLRQRAGVAVTLCVDGVGSRPAKEAAYRRLAGRADGIFDGFKVFYEEDGREMTPFQVLRLKPQPDLVVYE